MMQRLANSISLYQGDCLEILPTLDENSIDACVTDPPYGLGFMGKQWDGGDVAFRPETWAAVYRVLKPGAHLLAFGGTRTYHRMACAIEDAGFEIRDCIQWLYGSGFPKSHDVSKGIDRAAGAEREIIGQIIRGDVEKAKSSGVTMAAADANKNNKAIFGYGIEQITTPATDAARQWQGWGTALKPANEPVLLCAKPLQVNEHLTILLAEITARIILWLGCDASDAAKDLNASLVRLQGEASSVLDNAKIKSLVSIGIAPSAAAAFTLCKHALGGAIRIRDCFALSHVRQNGRPDKTSDQQTHVGAAVDTLIVAMCSSVIMGHTSENIASSWRSILDGFSKIGNTSTIETAISLTTALRTLNSLLVQTTSSDIGSLSPNADQIVLARKPLSEGTVAANVIKWGTGAINVDGCRVEYEDTQNPASNPLYRVQNNYRTVVGSDAAGSSFSIKPNGGNITANAKGRWPANVIHDGSEEVVGAFPETQSGKPSGVQNVQSATFGQSRPGRILTGFGDEGSAARFFYTAKASSDDRIGSKHPTVKPIDLMQYLVRLVTPKGGTVLDLFAGTGTTGEAAFREGMKSVLIEREEEYCKDVNRRIKLMLSGPDERKRESVKHKIGEKKHDIGPLFSQQD